MGYLPVISGDSQTSNMSAAHQMKDVIWYGCRTCLKYKGGIAANLSDYLSGFSVPRLTERNKCYAIWRGRRNNKLVLVDSLQTPLKLCHRFSFLTSKLAFDCRAINGHRRIDETVMIMPFCSRSFSCALFYTVPTITFGLQSPKSYHSRRRLKRECML